LAASVWTALAEYSCRPSALTLFFFFQAEDGIRGRTVTGVQTCALPIFGHSGRGWSRKRTIWWVSRPAPPRVSEGVANFKPSESRSEERRVGKEGRCWSAMEYDKKKDETRKNHKQRYRRARDTVQQ